MDAGLDLDLDIQVQLQLQLQSIVVHHVLPRRAATFGIIALRRLQRLAGPLPAAAPGDLTSQRARVGDGPVHGFGRLLDPVEGLHFAGDFGRVRVVEPLLFGEVLGLLLLLLGLLLRLGLGFRDLLLLGFVVVGVLFVLVGFAY